MRPRILVVHYSRTGHTRCVGEAIARALHADSEEIRDGIDRDGVIGYARSALESLLGASCEIRIPVLDPSTYDVVVIGTPAWNAAVSTPVRTYLWLERDRLPRIALYATCAGLGGRRAVDEMRRLAGKPPVATMVVREAELAAHAESGKLGRFARTILASAAAAPRRAHPAPGSRNGRATARHLAAPVTH